MEITVSRNELLRELTATQGVIERKTTIPILSNFLFEAVGEKLFITATDLDLSLRTSCLAQVKKEGAFTIPARKLYDYVKLLPDVDVALKLLENHWVSIRAGRSTTKMVGMARANFPATPTFPTVGVVTIPAQTLRTMIARTIFAISSEESRYTLNGALLVLKPESSYKDKFDVTGERRPLIPKKAMHELAGLLQPGEAESLEFAEDESTLFFQAGNRLLTARKLTGQFPNYEAVLPTQNTKVVVLRCDDMSGAIQRVAQFADERSGAIRLKLDKNELHLLANSNEMGEAEDIIETNYQEDPFTIGFNSQYLLDFLRATTAGEIRLELKDSQSAGQLCPAGNGDGYRYRYVVMPMRI